MDLLTLTPPQGYQPLDDVLTSLSALLEVAENEFIVGTGAGTYGHQDAATAATSMGLGVGDSPTLTGLTLSGLTIGSVVFAGASGVLSQDNSNLFWDDTNKRLEIGTGNRVMLAPLDITGDAATIEDRHEGMWIRGKTGAYIVQINVRGSRLEIGGGASLDTAPAMSVNYLTGKVGIGMTPDYILDIDAGDIGNDNYDGLRIVDTGWQATSHPMLEFYNSNEQFNGSLARIYGEIGNIGANSKLYFAVADSSKNLQDRMVIDKDGNVGIGIVTPTAALDIIGSVAPGFSLKGATAGYADAYYIYADNVAPDTAVAYVMRRSRGTLATPLIVEDDDRLGIFIAQGYDGDSFETAAAIRFYVDGDPGNGDMPGRIEFKTTLNGGVVEQTQMCIKNSGFIGIGAAYLIPAKRLDVFDSAAAQLRLTQNSTVDYCDFQVDGSGNLAISPSGGVITLAGNLGIGGVSVPGSTFELEFSNSTAMAGNQTAFGIQFHNTVGNSANTGSMLFFRQGAGGGESLAGVAGQVDGTDYGASILAFYTNDGATNPTEKMRINKLGYVGIGITNPLSKLHIGLATENLEFVDAGSAGATQQDWIKVEVGGVVGYIHVFAAV